LSLPRLLLAGSVFIYSSVVVNKHPVPAVAKGAVSVAISCLPTLHALINMDLK